MKTVILLMVLSLACSYVRCEAKQSEWKKHKAAADQAFRKGNLAKAEAEYLQSWNMIEKEDHLSLDLASAACDLGQVYGARKKFAEMQPKLVMAYISARMLFKQGKAADAEAIFKRAFEVAEKSYGPNDSRMGTHLAQVASFYEEEKKYELAQKYYERDLALKQTNKAPADELSVAYLNLGHLYLTQKNYALAEKFLNKSVAAIDPTGKSFASSSLERPTLYLIEVMERTNRPTEAKELKVKLGKVRAEISNFAQVVDEHNIKSVQKKPK